MQSQAKQEKAEAIGRLKEWLKPGDTVYTILRHTSRSGMQREISAVIFRDGHAFHPNHGVAAILGRPLNKPPVAHDAILFRGGAGGEANQIGRDLSKALGFTIRQEWL